MKLLILGGGGTLGAFSAGALQVLARSTWRPDAFIGSSAGAINLLRFFAAGPDAPHAFWHAMRLARIARDAVSRDRFGRGLLNERRFHARVDAGVDYARMFEDRRLFAFIVANLETGRVCVRGNRTECSAEDLRDVAHAAFALPPLLPPVHLRGEYLVDGGLLHNAPLEVAVDLGATEIVYLCNVHVLPNPGFRDHSAMRSARRYAEVFFRRASNVGFADADIVEDRFRGIPFLVIAPPASLRFGAVMRWMLPSVNAMDHLLAEGRRSAEVALTRWGWLEADHRAQLTCEAL